jgi:hypothetical protein
LPSFAIAIVEFESRDSAMAKYLTGPFPFAAMLLLIAVDAEGIRTTPGFGNPQIRTVNDQTSVMKCAKGKQYNARTRTCDPD